MSDNELDAFDLGDFEDLDAPPSIVQDEDVDIGGMGGPPRRNTRFLLLATVLVIFILVGAAGIIAIAGKIGGDRSDYQKTLNAIYETNTAVANAILNTGTAVAIAQQQTHIVESYTPTPTPSLTPSFTPTPTFTATATFTATIDDTGTAIANALTQTSIARTVGGTNAAKTLNAQLTLNAANTLTAAAISTRLTIAPTIPPTVGGAPPTGDNQVSHLAQTIQVIAATNQFLAGPGPAQTKTSFAKTLPTLSTLVRSSAQKTGQAATSIALVFTVTQSAAKTGTRVAAIVAGHPLNADTGGSGTGLRLQQDITSTPTLTPSETATENLGPAPSLIPLNTTGPAGPTPTDNGILLTLTALSDTSIESTQRANDATNAAIAKTIEFLGGVQGTPGGGIIGVDRSPQPVYITSPIFVINLTLTPLPSNTRTGTPGKGTPGMPTSGFFDIGDAGKPANANSLAIVGLAAISLVGVIFAARRLRVRI